MSENFTGITFSQRKVKPSDDAIVRKAILTDGVLTGCELSYSGYTLTMNPGQLLICGRQIMHPSVQNWAVADATSGYARLLLTIDMTRTSTKDSFDQVVDTIEYSETVNGFSTLTKNDINGAGTKYQYVVCVVSLGSGGITGIVSRAGSATISMNPEDIGAVPKTGGTLSGSLTVEAQPNGGQGYNVQKTVKDVVEELKIYVSSAGLPSIGFHENGAAVNRMVLNRDSTAFVKPVNIAGGGTGAATAEQALLNLGGISMKKVWENASRASSFAAQTLSLDLSGYDEVLIYSCLEASTNNDYIVVSRCPIGERALAHFTWGDDNVSLHRFAKTSKTGIEFLNAYHGGAQDNASLMPYRIYGIKGVSK